jgi:hypothetical protein
MFGSAKKRTLTVAKDSHILLLLQSADKKLVCGNELRRRQVIRTPRDERDIVCHVVAWTKKTSAPPLGNECVSCIVWISDALVPPRRKPKTCFQVIFFVRTPMQLDSLVVFWNVRPSGRFPWSYTPFTLNTTVWGKNHRYLPPNLHPPNSASTCQVHLVVLTSRKKAHPRWDKRLTHFEQIVSEWKNGTR